MHITQVVWLIKNAKNRMHLNRLNDLFLHDTYDISVLLFANPEFISEPYK